MAGSGVRPEAPPVGDPPRLRLALTLAAVDDRLRVSYVCHGLSVPAGAVVAKLPGRVAGLSTIPVDAMELDVRDDLGRVPVHHSMTSDDDDPVHCWQTPRPTRGPLRVSYIARPPGEVPAGAHPPLDLRAEGGGLSGCGRLFLALPPAEGPVDLRLRWIGLQQGSSGICSLGAGDLALTVADLEELRDSYFVVGSAAVSRHPSEPVSAHYLTRPPFDVTAFIDHTAAVHAHLAAVFGDDPPDLQVFFRHNAAQRGLSGAALTRSFVTGWNDQLTQSGERLEAFVDHELVHGWIDIDGPYEETVWHNEGLADYYGVVIPFRVGLLSESAFLRRINLHARLAFASTHREEPLSELAPAYWTDFRAQQEPYHRGFFYFAELDRALRSRATAISLEDLVRKVRRRQRLGDHVDVVAWQTMVEAEIGALARELLEPVLLGSLRLPDPEIWGPRLRCRLEEVPVLDIGFAPSTYITNVVSGLRPGTVAANAGLRDGDILLGLPSYEDLVLRSPGDVFEVRLMRDGTEERAILHAFDTTTQAPQWFPGREVPR